MPSTCAADTRRAMYCASAHSFTQIFGDAIGNDLVRQRLTLVLAVEPDNMKTVAGRDRFHRDLAGREGLQRPFEFGCGLPVDDLAEVAALFRRRTARIGLGESGNSPPT